MLIADLASTTLTITGVTFNQYELARTMNGRPNALVVLGLTGFVVAPPAIHFVHGRLGAAFGSFGLRAGAPTLLALLGQATCPNYNGGEGPSADCTDLMGLSGAVLGILVASAVDSAALSTETLKSASAPAARLSLVPALSADGKRGELRLIGAF